MPANSKTPLTYRNPWYRPGHWEFGPEMYEVKSTPIEYRGYQIFRRMAECYDVVKDGCCVGQYAGASGAKGFIDTLLGEGDPEICAFNQKRVARYFTAALASTKD